MKFYSVFFLVLCSSVLSCVFSEDEIISNTNDKTDLSNGLNKGINWVSLENGIQIAKNDSLPLFVMIHSLTCPACIKLSAQLKTDLEFKDIADNFAMVNLLDDGSRVLENKYKPDGDYLPRILFFEPEGQFIDDLVSTENPKYKYFHSKVDQVVKLMEDQLLKSINVEPVSFDDEDLTFDEDQTSDFDDVKELFNMHSGIDIDNYDEEDMEEGEKEQGEDLNENGEVNEGEGEQVFDLNENKDGELKEGEDHNEVEDLDIVDGHAGGKEGSHEHGPEEGNHDEL